MSEILEHDYEPEPGIPEPLPASETLLWRGAPDFRSLLFGSFRFATLLAYFGVLLFAHFALNVQAAGLVSAAVSTAKYAALSAVAVGILAAYAWYLARGTMYTVTSKRIVLRTGVALPVTINLPFSRIEAVDGRFRSDGSGDLVIVPERESRVSWLLIWPMVSPFRWFRVRPVLRGVQDVSTVAEKLAGALGQSIEHEAEAREVERTPDKAQPLASSADGGRRFKPYPTVPLAAMVSLVVIAFVGASWSVLFGESPSGDLPEPLEASVQLYFDDVDDGSVIVRDARTGIVLDTLDPGTSGFVRATLRTLVSARATVDAGDEEPFEVGETATGRVFLIDPVTGRQIDLRAFGPTNAAAFSRFINAGETGGGEKTAAAADPADTRVALRQEESTQ